MSDRFKFRAWDGKKMSAPFEYGRMITFDNHRSYIVFREDLIMMQCTGKKDNKGKDVFEGDIFRIEEATDDDDELNYVVIVWIKEWCMFAALLIDEYHKYLSEGAESLDEPLFWTYPITYIDSPKHFLCGNIYQHKHLLE